MNYKDEIFRLVDPLCECDDRGAFVEFAVEASDDLYADFAKKSDIIKASGYDSYEDFYAVLEEDGNDIYLDIYITARENDVVEAVITLHGAFVSYPVALNDEEKRELLAIVSDSCEKECEASLDELLKEAKEDAEEHNEPSKEDKPLSKNDKCRGER